MPRVRTRTRALSPGSGARVRVRTRGTRRYDEAQAVLVQPDGKIVVLGSSRSTSTNLASIAIVRYKPDGSLDSSFGTKGKVTTAVGSRSAMPYAGLIQADGRIVVASTAYVNGSDRFAVLRYNTNGTLDPTFGNGGVDTSLAIPGGPRGIAAQGTNLLVSGIALDPYGNMDFGLARYTADGHLDTTFGQGGRVVTPMSASNSAPTVSVLADGRIVVAGSAYSGDSATGYDAFAVARYNPDGTLDPTFGVGGVAKLALPTINASGRVSVVEPDGKVTVVGWANSTTQGFLAARFNADGTVDTTFGVGGIVRTPIGKTRAGANAAILQRDGRLVTAGFASDDKNVYDFALARYNTDGTLDPTF